MRRPSCCSTGRTISGFNASSLALDIVAKVIIDPARRTIKCMKDYMNALVTVTVLNHLRVSVTTNEFQRPRE